MNTIESREERALRAGFAVPATQPTPKSRTRAICGAIFLALVALIYGRDLYALAMHAAGNELHSHVVLIPFICAYLVYLNRGSAIPLRSSFIPGAIAAAAGLAAYFFARQLAAGGAVSLNDYLGLKTFSFICVLIGGGFFFLGANWMKRAAFPAAFLYFMIPLPDHVVELLETLSKFGSAETANLFFWLSQTPFLRSGLFFQLPGITIEVAQECSGIRSSYVLLITSVLASYLFLSQPWRRLLLVALVIPLGLLRNGFRILVIGLLCVYINPDMIHSVIHRRGGPIFFVLSLIPLFGILWLLRRGEQQRQARSPDACHTADTGTSS